MKNPTELILRSLHHGEKTSPELRFECELSKSAVDVALRSLRDEGKIQVIDLGYKEHDRHHPRLYALSDGVKITVPEKPKDIHPMLAWGL